VSEIYQSSTHGDIPLSFTGRRLLANLREAITSALGTCDYSANGQALSRARGDIAQYMSKLEGRQFDCDWSTSEARTLAHAMRSTPPFPWRETRTPEKQAADEFMEAAREFNKARAKLLRCVKQCQHFGLRPTWINRSNPASRKPHLFDRPHYFQPLTFEVSRVVKTSRVVEDEHVEVMGRVP
jgi:hypothetical protein